MTFDPPAPGRPVSTTPLAVILRQEVAPMFVNRFKNAPVAFFAASDYLRALQTILSQGPGILVFDAAFAKTGRAGALVACVREDPGLGGVELRTLPIDRKSLPALLKATAATIHDVILHASHPLQNYGTRAAERLRVSDWVLAVVNDAPGHLVNVSTTGAQIVLTERVKLHEHVRVTLSDPVMDVHLWGEIVWSSVVMSGPSISYRVGVQFADPDPIILEVFCRRHGASLADAADEVFGQREMTPELPGI